MYLLASCDSLMVFIKYGKEPHMQYKKKQVKCDEKKYRHDNVITS
jgi:hypothetical protein